MGTRASDGPTFGNYLSEDASRIPDPDAGMPWRTLLLGYWASRVWDSIWEKLDANQDGRISSDEMQALDSDGDQQLNRTELLSAMKGVRGLECCKEEESFINEILRVAGDRDSDGKLSLTEINLAHATK